MLQIDTRAARTPTGLVLIGLTVVWGLLFLFYAGWERPPKFIAREEVWKVVQQEAAKHDLDPRFVFAIIAAESSFNARARNGDARGLMQLRPLAWKEVSDKSHRRAWNWKENIAVGTAYLGFCKTFLETRGQFSYPRLAASYRFGPYAVQKAGFQLDQLPATRNEIYRELLRGNRAPVPIP